LYLRNIYLFLFGNNIYILKNYVAKTDPQDSLLTNCVQKDCNMRIPQNVDGSKTCSMVGDTSDSSCYYKPPEVMNKYMCYLWLWYIRI
jgi:hypothetical protein